MEPGPPLRIERVGAAELLELRRKVLRDNDANARVSDVRDDRPDSLHVAGYLGPQLVAGASFFMTEPPFDSKLEAAQLRYMAVLEIFQHQGHGTALLEGAIPLLKDMGIEILWANARISALAFYQANGWVEIPGTEHVSPPPVSLPHSVIYKVIK
jgi:GNAT superfamily N-acetyltransferase